MKRKAYTVAVPALVLAAAALLSFVLSARVHAGGGVKLRPPFERADGTYRVTAYFDHQNPNYGDDDYIWIYNGERRPANSQDDAPACTGAPSRITPGYARHCMTPPPVQVPLTRMTGTTGGIGL